MYLFGLAALGRRSEKDTVYGMDYTNCLYLGPQLRDLTEHKIVAYKQMFLYANTAVLYVSVLVFRYQVSCVCMPERSSPSLT